jgi:hypothetical protein
MTKVEDEAPSIASFDFLVDLFRLDAHSTVEAWKGGSRYVA